MNVRNTIKLYGPYNDTISILSGEMFQEITNLSLNDTGKTSHKVSDIKTQISSKKEGDCLSSLPKYSDKWSCYSRSARLHKEIRSSIYPYLLQDPNLLQISETIEKTLKEKTSFNPLSPLTTGQAFPTGVNSGFVAAHHTPNPLLCSLDSATVSSGVLSIDFGVHTYGCLIDCAFSVCTDSDFVPLLEATKAATEAGIKEAGPDKRIGELGEVIEEVLESFTVEATEEKFKGRNLRVEYSQPRTDCSSEDNIVRNVVKKKVKVVANLCGHSIDRYKVHAGKTISNVRNNDKDRMEAGEVFAIETFGSTGKGLVSDYGGSMECSHYMIKDRRIIGSLGVEDFTEKAVKKEAKTKKASASKGKDNIAKEVSHERIERSREALRRMSFSSDSAKGVAAVLRSEFGGLAFCKRWLNDKFSNGAKGWALGLRSLVMAGVVEDYPPLADTPGCQVSQFEHTIRIKEEGVEILSKGSDY